MKVAPENIFPGARIKSGEITLTVVKVNQKTFYASEMNYAEFVEKFNSRLKGTTFLSFCKAYGIKSYKYTENFEIEENEFNRKTIAEENTKDIYKLESWERADIISMIDYFQKKEKSIRLFQFSSRSKLIRFLEQRENSYLLNIEGDYVLLSIDTNECIKIATVQDYCDKFKSVPWEKLSCFAQTKEMASA